MSNRSPRRPIPQLENIELVSEGWLNKYVLTYRLPNGATHTYDCVSRKKPEAYRTELENNARGGAPAIDAVCVLPVLPDGSLLLIREFRYPLNAWCVSFPAGLMEHDVSLEENIDRELREETGYRLRADLGSKALRPLPQAGYSTTGMSEESVHIVIAQVEPCGRPEPEPTELIEPFVLRRNEIAQFLATNTEPIGTRAQLLLELALRAKDF